MSVIGIDFGNKCGVLAVARKGGIDILDNESGNRQTPNMVGYPANGGCASVSQKKRSVGETAQTNFNRNMKNTVINVKRWLGVPNVDSAIDKNDVNRSTCPILDSEPLSNPEEQRRLQTVMFKVGSNLLRPEQVAAVFLSHLKQIGENHTQKPVRDVVLSVPGWWGERQRRALLDAAQIAGLNVLRLLNEHAAVALTYGLVKTDLPEESAGARKVLFVDMGHSCTTAQVVAFVKGKMTVQGLAFDPTLGGRNFDEVVAAHVAADATKKLRAEFDLRESPRSWQRILAACEKQVKRVLSAGTPRANLSIDNLANDMDYNLVLQREDFVKLVQPLVERMAAPVQAAMKQAGVEAKDLYSVEIVGGGMRLPLCQEYLSQLLGGRELSRTINMEEGVAKGCAWMCAMLSPLFHVKPFDVVDISPYPIRIAWKNLVDDAAMEDEEKKKSSGSAIIISKNNTLPAPKSINFSRKQGIQMTAFYETPQTTPCCPGGDGWIGTYTIPEIPPTTKPDVKPKLIVHAELNINGLLNVVSAETNEVVEEVVEIEEPAKPAPAPQKAAAPAPAPAPAAAAPEAAKPADANATPAAPAPEAAKPAEGADPSAMVDDPKAETPAPAAGAAPAPAADQAAAAAPAPAPEEKKVKKTEIKKRTVKKNVTVKCETLGLSKKEIDHFTEVELQMAAEDRLAMETAEAKNHLETYQYTMRDKLTASAYGSEKSLALFGQESEVADFLKKLEAVRDWLYEDGEDQTKGVYTQKLAELKAIGDSYVRRKTEFDSRPGAISDLESRLQFWAVTAAASNTDEKYSHIEAAEREKVRAKCTEITTWLNEQRTKQDAAPLYAEPTLTVGMITNRRAELDKFAASIMNKPKPPPPKPEPKPEAKPEEKPADAKPADQANPPPVPPEPAKEEEQAPMTDGPTPAATPEAKKPAEADPSAMN